MDDDVQVQARALGSPTRHAVFRYLVDADRPVGVAELTEQFGFNHKAIRQHLAKLVDAGLVTEAQAPPSGRGRPRLQYTVAPTTESRWGAIGSYEMLSTMLTEIIRSGDTPREVGRRVATGLGHEVADGRDATTVLVDQMSRQGFSPRVRVRGDAVEITAQECPFPSAVLTDSDTICQLHLGMAEGIADAVGGLTIEELVTKDPRRAHCRLKCRTDVD